MSRGEIHGVACSRGGPQLSHLFFADDSLLFCQATKEESETFLANLKLYEKASSQLVSMEKTSLFFFSRNTSEEIRDGIKECIGIPKIKEHEKYLGLPSFVGKAKYRTFSELKEKAWKRVNGWKKQLLS